MRTRYTDAVLWIAANDNLGDGEPADSIEGYLTVALVADVFRKPAMLIAAQVCLARAHYHLTGIWRFIPTPRR